MDRFLSTSAHYPRSRSRNTPFSTLKLACLNGRFLTFGDRFSSFNPLSPKKYKIIQKGWIFDPLRYEVQDGGHEWMKHKCIVVGGSGRTL